MTPQELKNSILQLAIQGKLVEQRPEEGTAAELVEKILAAKNAKGAKGNLTRSRGARGEKEASALSASPREKIPDDEKPFDIPESWEWVRLGEVFNIVNGFTPLKSNSEFWVNGEIPWFTINDVHRQGRFITTTEKCITKKALSKNSERVVPSNTVLLCCTASIGEYAFAKIPLTTNQQFNALVVKEPYRSLIDPLFVLEFVKTLKGKLIELAGKTTFNFVSVGKVSNILFPLPPLAEQKRIVAKIEELLPLIDRYEKAWSKLEDFNKRFPVDMQKSLLQMAIQGKLVEQRPEEGTAAELLEKIFAAKNAKGAKGNLTRSRGARGENKTSAPSASPREKIPDDEKHFDIPESWEWVRLGNLLKVIGGVSYDKKDVCNAGLRILRGGNIQNMEILLDDADVFLPEQYRDNEKIVRVGDILIVASTGSKTVIGKAGYVDEPIPQTMIGAFLRICRPSLLEFVGYLRIIFESDFYRKHIRELSQGTNINNIKEAYITQFAIPLPPLAEQKRIVAKLEELLPLCERLK